MLDDGDTETHWLDQVWSAAAHEQPIAAFLTSVKVTIRCLLSSQPAFCCTCGPSTERSAQLILVHGVQVSRLLAVKAGADDASFSIMHEQPAQFHTVRH